MLAYIILTGIAGLSFTAGWLMKSISVANLINKAKKDIKYVDTLKSEAYSKGWNSGYGYRGLPHKRCTDCGRGAASRAKALPALQAAYKSA